MIHLTLKGLVNIASAGKKKKKLIALVHAKKTWISQVQAEKNS